MILIVYEGAVDMRRIDREVTDFNHFVEIIDRFDYCHLGFWDGKNLQTVPLKFGCKALGQRVTLYFLSSKEGREIDLIKQGRKVGFMMVYNHEVVRSKTTCDNVFGNGIISIVEDFVEKEEGLHRLMHKLTKNADLKMPKEIIEAVCMYKVDVTKLSYKSQAKM